MRVDFFKASGKWYTTEEVLLENPPLGGWEMEKGTASFERFLGTQLHYTDDDGEHRIRYSGMTAVALDWGGVPVLAIVPRLAPAEKATPFKLVLISIVEEKDLIDSSARLGNTVPKLSCNRHKDCDAANAAAKAKYESASPNEKAHLPLWADHCNDETCEDCFGN